MIGTSVRPRPRLAAILRDANRLVAAEWNGYRGPLVCEGCHRTISIGHAEDCPHKAWIEAVREAADWVDRRYPELGEPSPDPPVEEPRR